MKASITFMAILLLFSTSIFAQNTQSNSTESSFTEIKTMKHRVAKGETLYALSRLYHVSVADIAEMNPFIQGNQISVNNVLLIPISETFISGIEGQNRVEMTGTVQNAGRARSSSGSVALPTGNNTTATTATTTTTTTTKSNSKSYQVHSTPVRSNDIINFPIPSIPNTSTTKTVFQGDTPPTHIVQKGETLFSLARYYSMDVKKLQRINRMGENDSLDESEMVFLRNLHSHSRQTLLAEHNKKLEYAKNPQARENDLVDKVDYSEMTPITHLTQKGETLYSLSRNYSHSVSSIKKWNNMRQDELAVGDEVVVGWMVPGREVSGNVESAGVSMKPARAEKIARERAVYDQMTKYESKFRQQLANSYNSELVNGKCLGTWIRGEDSSESNLYALSRSIPPMTVVHVTNPMNGKTVYVKVISELPATSGNDRVEMKLTGAAVKELGILDKKFQLEYSYFVEQ